MKDSNEIMETLRTETENNTVKCNAPKLKRTFTYRKTTAIKASDVRL